MTVFFTADTHFGHERTLRLSRRPFTTVAAMDIAMVNNWNRVVDDIVYHLGDFGNLEIASNLAGQVSFLPGNYDNHVTVRMLSRYWELMFWTDRWIVI